MAGSHAKLAKAMLVHAKPAKATLSGWKPGKGKIRRSIGRREKGWERGNDFQIIFKGPFLKLFIQIMYTWGHLEVRNGMLK